MLLFITLFLTILCAPASVEESAHTLPIRVYVRILFSLHLHINTRTFLMCAYQLSGSST